LGIQGFTFISSFTNPVVDDYIFAARILLSIMMAYMMVVFLAYARWESEFHTHVLLLGVGGFGLLASNPLKLFIPSLPGIRFLDHFAMALFLSAYRLFLLLQLDLLRRQSAFLDERVTIPLLILSWVYAAIDTAASFDQAQHGSSRTVRAGAHAVYFTISSLFVVFALLGYDSAYGRRMAFIVGSVLLTDLVTIAVEVAPVQRTVPESVTPALMMTSVHGVLAGMALFLLRSGSGPEYEDLKGGRQNETNLALGVEEI
jgi:hypothetical protein